MRKFKLTSIQEELQDIPIRGVWYNNILEYGSRGVKTLYIDGVISNGEAPEKDRDKVWRYNLTIPESNGRTAVLSDETTHYFSNLITTFECEDWDISEEKDWNRLLTTASTPMNIREKVIAQSIVWALQHHSEVEFTFPNGQPNKNCQYPMFKLVDITEQQQKVVDNEMAYLDIVEELRPIYKSDLHEIKNICYGLGMAGHINKNKDNPNALFMELLKEVKADPAKFKRYFDNRHDRVNFFKGREFGIIEHNGAAFFIMGEIMGASPEEAISWLKLNPNRYDTLLNKLQEIDPKPGRASQPTADFDKDEVLKKCPFESTARQSAKQLRKKYAGNEQSLQLLEETFKEIAQNKGWEYEKVFVGNSN